MIVNYELAVEAIKDGIKEYTDNPNYADHEAWRNVVCGMSKALYILEDVERNSSYSKSLSGLDSNALGNLKKCIDTRLRDIDKEDKVEIYRLTIDALCYYYSNANAARAGMLEELSGLDDDFDELEIEIKPMMIPKSELSNYHIIL